MDYGYCRCSTDESRQDIDRQKRELRKLGVEDENIYWEYVSGSKVDKIEWNRLIDKIETGDCIMTTEVSRLTRSTKQLCEIIELAKEKRIKLVIGGMVIDCTDSEMDPMTMGMVMMLGVFAELEKSLISQRVKSGMANAKQKGVKIGRPASNIDNLPAGFMRHYPKHLKGELNITELARLVGVSRQSIYNYISVYEGGI